MRVPLDAAVGAAERLRVQEKCWLDETCVDAECESSVRCVTRALTNQRQTNRLRLKQLRFR